MYEVEFYYDRNGRSKIVEYLDELKEKGGTSKTERINRDKILAYMMALKQYGTRIGQPIVKHIDGSLWELRPLSNRIIFFYWKDNRFVLLHHFIKKTQKTPPREIEQARSKMKDFLERYGEEYE
ncbi:MAG: type II toxin-antitoxin system RelE/ParE family toxin [Oscillospiraceae bacterium]|nr:type II toxin-antitoxin system RelE/ParE family toxin [Oscillospiraceae bacterium]